MATIRRKYSNKEDDMRKRLSFAISNTLGKSCEVNTFSGQSFKGQLSCLSREGALFCNVSSYQSIPDSFAIKLRSLESIEVNGITLFARKSFKTDRRMMSDHASSQRKLEKWHDDGGTETILDVGDPNWDQFEANKKLFGISAEFDESQYNVPQVMPSELTPAQLAQADKVAAELSGQNHDEDPVEDEEAAFGAVLGTGRYTEQRKRTDSFASTVVDKDAKNNYKETRKQLDCGKNIRGKEGSNLDGLNLMISKPGFDEEARIAYSRFVKSKQTKFPVNLVELYFKEWDSNDKSNELETWT